MGREQNGNGTTGTRRKVRACAREKLGFEEMRPGQEDAVSAILEGHDVLAVLPTGTGKSAIYKIAGALLEGPTIVVSPLIALQRDQVQTLENEDVGDAAQMNSAVPAQERAQALEQVEEGDLEFLFLAPEQFRNPETLARLTAARPSLFVIDEAHCISEWGHDFRPDYMRLGAVVESLGRPRILALTATAAPNVREEIVERLEMQNVATVVTGFDRPNIWLGVRRFHDEDAKRHALIEAVLGGEKPGIVYVSSRRHAEEIAEELVAHGVDAVAYHAGMKMADRERAQEAFMGGGADIIVATNAFGMGIDKPDVRFVFHFDISDSVDAYYQEIGRAGRDGNQAMAMLFYRPQDMAIHRFHAGSGRVKASDMERVVEALRDQDEPVAPTELKEGADLSAAKVNTAITRLEDAGALDVLPTGDVTSLDNVNVRDVVKEATRAEGERQRYGEWRLQRVQEYAETTECRRARLLQYFGEEPDGPCGHCDNCDAVPPVEMDVGGPFRLNSRVLHKAWGEGVVARYEDGRVVVRFEDAGEKTLDLEIVEQEKLLEPVPS